ncbi:hypothetical protein E3N88_03857 [Mikania micrantha]|uniref:Aquaporin n=1 Tax=Mikania micrantha TaxID=192012 RepID=A0A5N6PSQ6_9ASTR|nr:hypothetical protein E3N88_03857 [Mikania micrantha]
MSSKDHNRDLEDSKSAKAQSRRYDGSIICSSPEVVAVIQKVFAETVGTYFLIFVGCGAFVVDKQYGSITFPGMCVAWGLIIMVMVYAVGHISGAHLNPAVPSYIAAQLLGSILASGTLCLLFQVEQEYFFGTVPKGRIGRNRHWNDDTRKCAYGRASIRSVNEPCEEPWASYSDARVQGDMDLYGWPDGWHHYGRFRL